MRIRLWLEYHLGSYNSIEDPGWVQSQIRLDTPSLSDESCLHVAYSQTLLSSSGTKLLLRTICTSWKVKL